MSRTLSELAQEAIDVQNASNLCGVAQSFARAMVDLRAHCTGTKQVNEHAIARLWLCKLASLANTSPVAELTGYSECERLAGLKDGAP